MDEEGDKRVEEGREYVGRKKEGRRTRASDLSAQRVRTSRVEESCRYTDIAEERREDPWKGEDRR